jgi:8-oxo-dGTP diphosphatase
VPYQPIVATLGYVVSSDRQNVLLIHRNARSEDLHLGKYNGLGGKLDPEESVTEGMRRELREEATIEVSELVLRGTISWPGFGKGGEDWFGFLFRIDAFTGTVPARNAEGTLSWQPIAALLKGELPLWEGDRHFLPLIFDADPRAFHGVMPYRDGRPATWRYERI